MKQKKKCGECCTYRVGESVGPQRRVIREWIILGGESRGFRTMCFLGFFWELLGFVFRIHLSVSEGLPHALALVSSLHQIFVRYQIPPLSRCRILCRNTQKPKECCFGFLLGLLVCLFSTRRTSPRWSGRGLHLSPMAFWGHDMPALTRG